MFGRHQAEAGAPCKPLARQIAADIDAFMGALARRDQRQTLVAGEQMIVLVDRSRIADIVRAYCNGGTEPNQTRPERKQGTRIFHAAPSTYG